MDTADVRGRRWRALPAWSGRARWAAAGGLVLPAAVVASDPIDGTWLDALLGAVVFTAMACVAWRLGRGRLAGAMAGCIALATGAWLAGAASNPLSAWVDAALLGAGIGLLLPNARPRPVDAAAPVAAAAMLVAVSAAWGVVPASAVLGMLAAAAAFVLSTQHSAAKMGIRIRGLDSAPGSPPSPPTPLPLRGRGERRRLGYRSRRRGTQHSAPSTRTPLRANVMAGATVVFAVFSVFWIGSTSSRTTWFGSLTWHGPRDRMEVALTFDDGPNPDDTLRIAGILDGAGVRGTFFSVGKAVVQRPDITRELVARGHLVGNHSYNHGAFSYLEPAYPELDETQVAIQANAGVCPAIFRPPHGTHTPFMSRIVDKRHMQLVTWDVSARDWAEHDPERLARNVLAKVRPGSIILLHDGIDGNIPADRSVVVRALPAIIAGLRERGLKPVRLDELLGIPGYLPSSDCAT